MSKNCFLVQVNLSPHIGIGLRTKRDPLMWIYLFAIEAPIAGDACCLDLEREAWVQVVSKTPEGQLKQRDT